MAEEKTTEEREMSLVGHLGELRSRLVICLAAVILITLIVFPFAKSAVTFLIEPIVSIQADPARPEPLRINVGTDGRLSIDNNQSIKDISKLSHRQLVFHFEPDPAQPAPPPADLFVGEGMNQRVVYPSPIDPVMLQLKLTIIISVVLALPVILWQLWLFIKPGLTRRERAFFKPLMMGALLLFPTGALFAYIMFNNLLMILTHYTITGLDPLINVHSYLTLIFTLMLVFGILFEIPLIIALGARIGLVTPAFLRLYRRHAYVVLAFLAMVFTPADPFSMLMMFLPLVGLYEMSIACSIPMAKLHQRDLQTSASEETVS